MVNGWGGELVAVVGGVGSGKSALLQVCRPGTVDEMEIL